MEKKCFSHLAEREQLGAIASEIARARVWAEKANISRRDSAVRRALELLDYFLSGSPSLVPRDELESWKARLQSVDADEGLLADVEARLVKILTAQHARH
jgi:hypothetical protein